MRLRCEFSQSCSLPSQSSLTQIRPLFLGRTSPDYMAITKVASLDFALSAGITFAYHPDLLTKCLANVAQRRGVLSLWRR